ncbi:hypothetical protein [Tabrizicola sp. TH137]|uniref:hypothetical protein n=1 Tax=Tabrizicola sp. TH137 TaxID=2067452 RepID=UPI00117BEC1E|nr:hypothetical protein [Tabrizicola sp. TH137]
MTDFWKELVDDQGSVSINLFRFGNGSDYPKKAAVIVFGGRVTLTADSKLWENAVRGSYIDNFILAHEAGHVQLDHHARGAVNKHFELYKGEAGFAIRPPTLEEEEANLAAVFLQCGTALEDYRIASSDLAYRAFTDRTYVDRARRFVPLSAFKRNLRRSKPRAMRIIL